ncbi:hypothetical protein OPV22_033521 [Ensete ventricosum]|uniref:SWIB domain-containing protein n=1 Tax=Ensete ventricosum TaxID=4639 RepID=A0AAV8PS50_ENSVE|nr:hypothetical protein OPV22_033521 [Ensete ventricosum]
MVLPQSPGNSLLLSPLASLRYSNRLSFLFSTSKGNPRFGGHRTSDHGGVDQLPYASLLQRPLVGHLASRRAVHLCGCLPLRRWLAAAASRVAAEAAPDASGKRRPRGITKPRPVSPELQAVVSEAEIPRTQALKKIWAYIKENNLQVLLTQFILLPWKHSCIKCLKNMPHLQNNEGLLQTNLRMTSIVARMFVKMTPQLLIDGPDSGGSHQHFFSAAVFRVVGMQTPTA